METKEKNIIRRIIDPGKKPILTDEQKMRLDALATMPDDQIDYSDAPYLPDAVWVKVADLPSNRQQVTLHLDDEVLDFFRKTGTHYHSTINAVLRSYVDAQKALSK